MSGYFICGMLSISNFSTLGLPRFSTVLLGFQLFPPPQFRSGVSSCFASCKDSETGDIYFLPKPVPYFFKVVKLSLFARSLLWILVARFKT